MKRAVLALLFGLMVGLWGCPQAPPPEDPEPALFITTLGDAAPLVLADGAAQLPLVVVAVDASEERDNAPLQVDATGGRLFSSTGTLSNENRTLEDVPENGELNFAFGCEAGVAGDFLIRAENDKAHAQIDVNCYTED
jgi:hypothetical protein